MRLFALLDQDTYEAEIVAFTDTLETAAYMFAMTDGEPVLVAECGDVVLWDWEDFMLN